MDTLFQTDYEIHKAVAENRVEVKAYSGIFHRNA